jgi:hypothetical protein
MYRLTQALKAPLVKDYYYLSGRKGTLSSLLYIRQWEAGNVYLLVLSSWNVNIAENLIAVMGV